MCRRTGRATDLTRKASGGLRSSSESCAMPCPQSPVSLAHRPRSPFEALHSWLSLCRLRLCPALQRVPRWNGGSSRSIASTWSLFVDGGRQLPSSLKDRKSSAAPLLRLLMLCVTVGKPLFGTVSNLLAYLANVGPVPLTLRAGTLSSFGPPDDGGARLDKRTGDLFAWCSRHGAWIPIGNVIRSRCATCPPHSSRRC